MSFSSTSSSSSDEVNSIMEDFIVEDCIMRSSLSRRLELIEELLKRQTETRAYIDSSCENDSSTSAQTESLGLGSPAAMATSPPVKRRRTDHGGDRNDAIDISILQKLSPVVVFAHGAGAPSTSEWMIRSSLPPFSVWKARLEKALHAVEVVTFDYPYIADGKRRAPPKAEKLVDFHADVVRRTVAKYPGHPLILAGKSMGSRVSCMVASREDICASAIICLGYPLKGINGATRDEILVQLKVPIIFVQVVITPSRF
ncbi:hypothetical protein Ancab_015453 [Ancistrocladus abbreviatus]